MTAFLFSNDLYLVNFKMGRCVWYCTSYIFMSTVTYKFLHLKVVWFLAHSISGLHYNAAQALRTVQTCVRLWSYLSTRVEFYFFTSLYKTGSNGRVSPWAFLRQLPTSSDILLSFPSFSQTQFKYFYSNKWEKMTYLLRFQAWSQNVLTPWSRVLPEKLKRPDPLKKFPAFYGIRRFITAFWKETIQEK
jgi:hypothetical protein